MHPSHNSHTGMLAMLRHTVAFCEPVYLFNMANCPHGIAIWPISRQRYNVHIALA